MSEELSHEFLAFSEMLDEDEGLDPNSLPPDSDQAILLSLRRELRDGDIWSGPSTPVLPPDFAKSTVSQIKGKMASLPSVVRFLMPWEHFLRGDARSAAGLKGFSALAVLGLGSVVVSWKAFGALACLLLFSALGGTLLLKRYLPVDKELLAASTVGSRQAVGWLSRMFYLIPLLATFATAALFGNWASSLAGISLSFKYGENTPFLFEAAGFAIASLWLVYASLPLWGNWEKSSRGKRIFTTMSVQLFYGLWFLALVIIRFDLSKAADMLNRTERFWIAINSGVVWTLVVFLAIAIMLLFRSAEDEAVEINRSAWRQLFRGLLVGAIPILAMLFMSYQLSLTHNIIDESKYRKLSASVDNWLTKLSSSIPEPNDEQKLYCELFRRYYSTNYNSNETLSDSQQRAQNAEMALSFGRDLDSYVWPTSEVPAKWGTPEWSSADQNKLERFTKMLPFIEKLLSSAELKLWLQKRNFTKVDSYYGGPAMDICRGLSALTRIAMEKKEFKSALRYQKLSLKSLELFDLTLARDVEIRYVAESVALKSIQQLVFEGNLTRTELEGLLQELRATELAPSTLSDTVNRQIVSTERGLAKRVQGGRDSVSWADAYDLRDYLFTIFMPDSYWESERKAYINFQLGRTELWSDLAPLSLKDEEIAKKESSPWSSVAASVDRIDSWLLGQFLITLSRHQALELVVELQLYRLDHGAYPERLEQLVPGYRAELPVDAVSPKTWAKKDGFLYQKTEAGYKLSSSSRMYVQMRRPGRVVYGPENWKEVRF